MDPPIGFERCLSFINTQLRNGAPRICHEGDQGIKAVTISRQAGCGATVVAERLAEYLQARTPEDEPRWTVFDKNLVQRVLEEHNLPQRLARFMPETWTSEIDDTIEELFGLHPPSWLLVRETAETILRLVKLGNVIIIGRGANVITSRLNTVLHTKLVASLENRVKHIQESDHLDRKASLEFIHQEDKGRRRYLKKHYRMDINDPLLYHFVINTDLLGYEKAAQLMGNFVIESWPHPHSRRSIGLSQPAK